MFLRDYYWKKMSLWNRNRGTELEQYQTKRHCVFLKKLKITGLLGDFGSPSVGNQHVSVAKKIKNFELVPTPTSFIRSTASSKMEYSGKTLPYFFVLFWQKTKISFPSTFFNILPLASNINPAMTANQRVVWLSLSSVFCYKLLPGFASSYRDPQNT